MPFMAPIIYFFYETDLHSLTLYIVKEDRSDTQCHSVLKNASSPPKKNVCFSLRLPYFHFMTINNLICIVQ